MNDEEIRLIKGYFNDGYCCDLDELKNIANKMIKENNKLQSNWNSLRDWLKTERDYYFENYYYSDFNAYGSKLNDVLDKMNELEGGEDEKN